MGLIYNSRNYSILLNDTSSFVSVGIYNSRNYSILLNHIPITACTVSTTVEIILYYLTSSQRTTGKKSTTVEIILYYLTKMLYCVSWLSTTVEIILYYLTIVIPNSKLIYNSRNYSILLNEESLGW